MAMDRTQLSLERALQEDDIDRQDGRAALRRIADARRELERLYGVYHGDPIAEAREERERDRDRVLAEWTEADRRWRQPPPRPGG
jgi:hypothetical protein